MSERIKLNPRKCITSLKVVESSGGVSEIDDRELMLRDQLQKQYDAGFKSGYDAAFIELENRFNEKLNTRINEIHNIAEAFNNKSIEFEKFFEDSVLQLSLAMAEKIIKREIADRTIIDEVLRSSVKKITGANNVVVKINPADMDELSGEAKDLLLDTSFNKIKFEIDERIEQGGCFIESEIGNVDARISTQIGELKRNLDAVNTQE